jgi:hypothetical protein
LIARLVAREGRVALLVAAAVGALLALPPLVFHLLPFFRSSAPSAGTGSASNTPRAIGMLKEQGVSGLAAPHWWWGLALAASVLACVFLWRRAGRFAPAAFVAMMGTGGAIIAFVMIAGETSFAKPSYYLLKTMWSLTALILPMALVGLALVLKRAGDWVEADENHVKTRRIVVAGAVCAVLVPVAYRTFTHESKVKTYTKLGAGLANLRIPAVEELEKRFPNGTEPRPVVAFGMMPYGLNDLIILGHEDLFVRQASTWVGLKGLGNLEIDAHLQQRNPYVMCQFLELHPDTVRITGPSEKPGIGWLREIGCPESIIKANEWIVTPMPDEWFARWTAVYEKPYFYPTVAEFQKKQGSDAPLQKYRPGELSAMTAAATTGS